MASPPSREIFDAQGIYEDEQQGSKLTRKAKESPVVPLGIGGAVASIAYMAYRFKNRGITSPSIYFIHMRVYAQGIVVGAMGCGAIYSLVHQFILKDTPDSEK